MCGKSLIDIFARVGEDFRDFSFFEFYRKAEWRPELTDISAIRNPTMLPFALKKLDCMYSRLEGIFQNDPLLMSETRKSRTHTPIFACNILLQRLL